MKEKKHKNNHDMYDAISFFIHNQSNPPFVHAIKPPLGLTPKWVRDGERLVEVSEAIKRYVEFNMTTEGKLYKIPLEWVKEYNKHIDTVNKTLFSKEENKK